MGELNRDKIDYSPLYCISCNCSDTWQRRLEHDIKDIAGHALWYCWFCVKCGAETLIPVKED